MLALVLQWLKLAGSPAPSTGGEGQPSGFCPSCPSWSLNVPVLAPICQRLVHPAVLVWVSPSHAPLVPALGGAMVFGQPAFPRAGSPAPVPPWGPEGLVFLSSCSWFSVPILIPLSWPHADPTQHGWGRGGRSPAAMLTPAPHLLPAVAPDTRGSSWLSSVPTALLPSLQAAPGRLRTGMKPEVWLAS